MKSLTHVYYGYGKGKTTAALGLALRASGTGKKVVIVQFLKNTPTGELKSLALLPDVTVLRGTATGSFTCDMSEEEKLETKHIHDSNLNEALKLVNSGQCNLLILDEALDAYQLGLVDDKLFSDMVRNKPDSLELVITGHMPVPWIREQADYVTEMVKHKHPYDKGVKARKGIEF